ncbi:hypothetical protein GOP47_0002506 [Adiantum capillus-veneris]|uniref:Uncharacterized protein n=1 Tax=Adiantum capillus-veneris TaxID=13818 RepID=A0A9D4ZP62_ADICA|nr:hypothetical protein GOP47_0002506 [Adiantum capillus-veneris]
MGWFIKTKYENCFLSIKTKYEKLKQLKMAKYKKVDLTNSMRVKARNRLAQKIVAETLKDAGKKALAI